MAAVLERRVSGDGPGGDGADPNRPAGQQVEQARAYTGPAHGARWTVPADQPPAGRVRLFVAGRAVRYRLVLRANGLPARDSRSCYLYVPVPDPAVRPVTDGS